MRTPIASKLRWQFADPDSQINRQLQSFDWRAPETIDHAELIKENSQRQVWRFTLGQTEYYAKLYFRANLKWKLKRRLRGPDCLKEWRVAHYAAQHNLDCVKPVAYAITPASTGKLDSILITLSIPQALPLDDYWKIIADLDAKTRWTKVNILNDALAQLLAAAHHADLAHSDLHPGNLLIEPLAQDRCRAAFVDLHSIRVGNPVSQDKAANNLAQINQWFRKNATVTQRARFLKRYLEYRSRLSPETSPQFAPNAFKTWARALDQAAEKHAQKLLASRDRRIMRKSKYFTICNLKNYYHAHCFLKTRHPRDYAPASYEIFVPNDWKIALENPKKRLQNWAGQYSSQKLRGARFYHLTLQLGPNQIPIIAKHRLRKTPLSLLQRFCRISRAVRAWKISFAMIHREIPAAFPLAVLERRFGPVVAETLFITEDVPAAVNIFDVLNTSLPKISKSRQTVVKEVLSDKLAKLLRKMQAHNFIHRNLKGSNILIKNAALIDEPNFDPNSLEFVITDIDSVVRKKHLSEKDTLRPYRRLAVLTNSNPCISNTDRARFLKACLTHFGSGRPDWKTLWRKIQTAR